MEAIFNVSFIILCAVCLQKMVLAFNDSLESSFPHIRQKRMDPSPSVRTGSLPSHQLPPLLAYDLRSVNMIAPTKVSITRNGNIFGTGFAIHPYFILMRSLYVDSHHDCGVSTRNRFGEGYISQRIEHRYRDPTYKFVLIQLKDPIFLDDPKHGAFLAEKYPMSATNWAYYQVLQCIPGLLLRLRHLLKLNINELRLHNPTRVQITSVAGTHSGYGYAIHPYIIVTRPDFVGENAGVLSSFGPRAWPSSHRIQFRYPNRDLNIEVLELLDPIDLSDGVPYVLTAEGYSTQAIAWAHYRVEEWKRTRLEQTNYYQMNAE